MEKIINNALNCAGVAMVILIDVLLILLVAWILAAMSDAWFDMLRGFRKYKGENK